MSDNRKYYYLKLKDNFFDSEEMIVLQDMRDGYLYSDILMKLYLRSLKSNGKLMFNDSIAYNVSMLSKVVRHKETVVTKALDVFKQLGLIEVLENGAIFMLNIQNFIGQSSSEADRQREYQTRIALEKMNDSCKISNKKNNGIPTPEKEIEIETQLHTDKERNTKERNTFCDDSSATFDIDSLWKMLMKGYPIRRNAYPGKKVFIEKLSDKYNPIDYTKKLCIAANLCKEDYKKAHPEDPTLRYMPSLKSWLEKESDKWLDKVEQLKDKGDEFIKQIDT